jgi:CHAT domain-containing protein/TolA-binding protein
MLHINPHHFLFFARICLLLTFAFGVPLSASAQTDDDAAIQKLILSGYRSYAKKDAAELFSLFSQQSPHLPEFKQFIQQEFAINEKVKIESLNVNLLRKLEIEGDGAKARVRVLIHAVDIDTGQEAEGFGEMDHTLRFVREDGAWKFWKFNDTAEELALKLLAATTDEERAAVLKAEGEPFTDGLLKGLANQAQSLTEEKGDYVKAALILNTLLNVGRQINSPLGIGNALIGLGDVYVAQGDYLRAADNYQQVMKLAESFNSKEAVAAVSVKLGNIHYHQGNFALAMEYYQRSAQAYEELGSKVEITYPLLNIGNAHFAQGNYAQALEYYQRVLKIYEKFSAKAGTAYLLNKIGEVYAAQGKLTEAIEDYDRSLKLHEELGNRAMMAYALNNSGNVRYSQGNYREAAALSTRAADIARESKDPEILWQALTSKGKALLALNEADAARASFSEAIAVIEQLRHTVVGNEQDQQLFFENKTAPYYAMVDLLVASNNWPEAFAYAERAKGRILLDVLKSGRENISKATTPEEQKQESKLNEAILSFNSQLRRENLLPKPDRERLSMLESQLKNARLEYEAFQMRLYAAHPELKAQRGQAETLTLAEAAALLPDAKTALLEYVVTQERVYLFAIAKGETAKDNRRDAVVLKVYPLNIKPLELKERVNGLRQKIADNALGFREPARELYDLLIKPAQTQLTGKTILCFIPDGSLWELPFQALLSSENKYLLEDYALFYAPSLSVLREMKKRESRRAYAVSARQTTLDGASAIQVSMNTPSASRTLLAFGNPALSESAVTQARSMSRDQTFNPLPEAEREVKSLTQFYRPTESKILVGAEAREETVKAEAEKYKVLHFATHGTLDDSNPMYSRLVLASASTHEDGFLEAREIINLNLNAELVVLSACQTARGRVAAGEGLIGMAWAFFVAGTPTTVASQWKVDSASTTLLMTNFHQLLTSQESKTAARANKAQALRGAALKLLSNPQYRHPFYWAGFVMIGDGD